MQIEKEYLLLLEGGRCPICRSRIHIMESDRIAIVKTTLIRMSIDSNQIYSKCRKCKTWLMIPLLANSTETTKVS